MDVVDRITLTGIRAFGHHGVLPEERRDGQEFVVDAELSLDTRPAAETDDVADTVHYGEVAEQIVRGVEGEPVNLLETLAARLAGEILALPRVRGVVLTVHKPAAPITVPFADVSVTIRRAKDPAGGELMDRRLAQGFRGAATSGSSPSVVAVVALGANLGERAETLAAAIEELRRLPLVDDVRAADPVESVAVTPHGRDASAPAYLNSVALVTTKLAPTVLLDYLHAIEARHGRERRERWGARTLDLDLIAYGEVQSADARLTLPHPRAAERDFVLAPWLSLDPDAELLGSGRVSDLLAALRAGGDAEGAR